MPEPVVRTSWQRWRGRILPTGARQYVAQKYRNNRGFWRIYAKKKKLLAASGERPTFRRTISETLSYFARYASRNPKRAAAYVASSLLPLGFLMRLAMPSIPHPDKDVLLRALAAEKGKSWRWFGWFRGKPPGYAPPAATIRTETLQQTPLVAKPGTALVPYNKALARQTQKAIAAASAYSGKYSRAKPPNRWVGGTTGRKAGGSRQGVPGVPALPRRQIAYRKTAA